MKQTSKTKIAQLKSEVSDSRLKVANTILTASLTIFGLASMGSLVASLVGFQSVKGIVDRAQREYEQLSALVEIATNQVEDINAGAETLKVLLDRTSDNSRDVSANVTRANLLDQQTKSKRNAAGTVTVIAEQRTAIQAVMLDKGFASVAEHGGKSASKRRSVFTRDLETNRDYVFVGFCDEGCSDLDLDLHDERGDLIDADYFPDDFPVLIAQPSDGGSFQFGISMFACAKELCKWSVEVFAKSR